MRHAKDFSKKPIYIKADNAEIGAYYVVAGNVLPNEFVVTCSGDSTPSDMLIIEVGEDFLDTMENDTGYDLFDSVEYDGFDHIYGEHHYRTGSKNVAMLALDDFKKFAMSRKTVTIDGVELDYSTRKPLRDLLAHWWKAKKAEQPKD